MKKILLLAAAVTAAAVLLTGCGDTDDPASVSPSVKLEKGTPGTDRLVFTLECTGADKAAYMVKAASEEAPQAGDILLGGTPAGTDGPQECTVTGLEPDTDYAVWAAAGAAGVYSSVARLEMRTLREGEPALRLSLVEEGTDAVVISVETADADRAAYVCLAEGTPLPDAAAILEQGTELPLEGPNEVTVGGLEAGKAYSIAAAAAGGGMLSEVAVLKVTAQELPYDVLVECTRFTGFYYGDMHTGSGNGNYYLSVTDIPFDDSGKSVGAGHIFYLDLYDVMAAKASEAMLSDGVYELDMADSHAEGTFSNEYSSMGEADEAGLQTGEWKFAAGTLTVESAGGTLKLLGELRATDGRRYKVLYEGPAAFENKVPDPAVDIWLEAKSNYTVYEGDTNYMGTSDEWTMTLWNADKSIELFLQFSTLCNDDISSPIIPDGSFVPDTGYDFLPGTFIPGQGFLGMDLGSFIVSREDGANVKMYITDGSFSTVRSGNEYTVTLDLVTEEGKSVSGSYSGPLVIDNRAREPIADHSVAADRVWRAQYFGSVSGSICRYYVQLTDGPFEGNLSEPEPVGGAQGNEIAMDFYGPASALVDDAVLPEGTYTIALNEGMFTLGPGYTVCNYFRGGGVPPETIYLSAGTAVVEHTAGGYSIRLEGINLSGNELTASYSGPIKFEYVKEIEFSPRAAAGYLYSLRAASHTAREPNAGNDARIRLPLSK